jgi:hypothetical protein
MNRGTELIFLASLIAILTSCNQSKTENNENEAASGIPEGAMVEPYPGQDELVRVSFNNAEQNREEGDYWKNRRHGSWAVYHINGMLKSLSGYVNGKKHGQSIELNDRGDMIQKANYLNDQLHGFFVLYEYGKVKEERYYANGLLEGAVRKFYRNGELKEESFYKNGLLDGTARWFDQDGNKTIEYEYRAGEWIKPDSLQ